ncbi:MAG: Flp pilus assembly protein CpaB [Actinomycetota bacterium]
MRSRTRRKWSGASRAFLALAIVLGGASFLLVRGYSARVDALAPAIGPSVSVLTAGRDLVRGTTLTAEMLKTIDVPAAYAPPGTVSRIQDAVGHTLVSDVAAGEAITRTRLGAQHAGPIASLVPSGMRAVTVPATTAGDVVVGDHVDVLATFGGGQPHTETTASGLEVIAVASASDASSQLTTDGGGSGATITVLAPPSMVESLAYASAFATVTVSVLGADEGAPSST